MTLYRIITNFLISKINWMQMNTAKKIVNFFFLWFVVEGKKKNNGEKSSPDLSSMNIFARFLNAVA